MGTPTKSGKLDFWPNGGERQPGCLVNRKFAAAQLAIGMMAVTHNIFNQFTQG